MTEVEKIAMDLGLMAEQVVPQDMKVIHPVPPLEDFHMRFQGVAWIGHADMMISTGGLLMTPSEPSNNSTYYR